ncbi:DUF6401 family natural product biosynthesis protein [Pseudonocardia sp. H11422]|uniref:DUF6401 family natural product biosynthesis protein n=1 Tax=Pseudonocardia sp. H11422 TaxID=2835866 RepID=UPI0039777AFD
MPRRLRAEPRRAATSWRRAVRTPQADQWQHADWPTLRLLAVCHLGRDVGRGAGRRRPAGA